MKLTNFRSWATPVTIGSFFISGISGVLMFFKINFGLIRVLHEWGSILMVLGVIFHIIANVKVFKNYFVKPISAGIISVFVLAGILAFTATGNSTGRKPFFDIASKMESVNLELAAQINQTDPELIQSHLVAHGFDVLSTDQTISEIAVLNKKDSQSVLSIVFEKE